MEIKNLFIFIFVSLILISLVGAGTYKQDECVNIQTTSNATSINISSITPASSDIVFINDVMEKNAYTFNYTFCNTSTLGEYYYDYFDNNGNVYSDSFYITSDGDEPSVAKAISYGILMFLSLILFIGSFIWFINIPFEKYSTSEEGIVKVTYDRTKKTIMFFLSYIFLLLISFIGKLMSSSMFYTNNLSTMFDSFFWILLVGLAPITIAVGAIAILTTIADNNLQKAIFRGMEV